MRRSLTIRKLVGWVTAPVFALIRFRSQWATAMERCEPAMFATLVVRRYIYY